MANFLGQRTRVEFNGHDVSHLTGVSIGSMGIMMDSYQSIKDPFDHDIEIEKEATGSFDFVASDVASGEQKFKEIFNLVRGYQDLDITTDVTTDSITSTDVDFVASDEVNYTVPRFMSKYRRLSACI